MLNELDLKFKDKEGILMLINGIELSNLGV